MSTMVMSQCWPLSMPPTPKAVLISLADNANDHGECWPSIPTIAMRTCFSERAVQNAIKWLESVSILTADRTNGRHTRYSLTPAAYAPPQEIHPAAGASEPPQEIPKPPQEVHQPPQEVPSNRKEPSRTVKATTSRAPKKVGLPEGFSVSEAVKAWAEKNGYRNLDQHLTYFIGYATANGKTYANWDQALMNAIRDDWAKLAGKVQVAAPVASRVTGSKAALAPTESKLDREIGYLRHQAQLRDWTPEYLGDQIKAAKDRANGSGESFVGRWTDAIRKM
jgi:hypothetical protein